MIDPEIVIFKEQLRELNKRIGTLEQETVTNEIVPETTIVPSLVNFADNSDFVFTDEAYNVGTGYTAYTDDEDVLAHWYGRTQATSTAWVENASATESSESIRKSTHGSGARTGFEWSGSEGSLLLTGGYRIGTRLHMKHASAGNYMAVRCQVSRVSGAAAPTETIKLKASIWDNTDTRILRGSKPPIDSTRIGTSGSVRRDYILEVQMPDGRTFYSDTVTFVNGDNRIDDSIATTSISDTQYVTVAWEAVTGSSRYRIYRRTPSEADTNWYLIGTVTNGGTQINDFGGTGGGTWTIPSFDTDHLEYQLAQGFYDDIGELLQTEDNIREISIGLRVPYNFSPNGNQFLQLEFVKEDYSNTTTTEIPADGIRIDKVGLSYTNGRWAASSRDMAVAAAALTVDPPPSGGGDGDNPPDGGGIDTCVVDTTPILIWDDGGNHYYMPANEIVQGDKLVSWDVKLKTLAPTTVNKVIKGISSSIYMLHSEVKGLTCSFSHRNISNFEDFEFGTAVRNLESGLYYEDGEISEKPILSKEILNIRSKVITFRLSKNRRNYIANGWFCHNVKILPIE